MEKDQERAEPEYVQEMWDDEGEPVSELVIWRKLQED